MNTTPKYKWEILLEKQTESKDLLECCNAVFKNVFYDLEELRTKNGGNRLDYLIDRIEAEIKRLNEKE